MLRLSQPPSSPPTLEHPVLSPRPLSLRHPGTLVARRRARLLPFYLLVSIGWQRYVSVRYLLRVWANVELIPTTLVRYRKSLREGVDRKQERNDGGCAGSWGMLVVASYTPTTLPPAVLPSCRPAILPTACQPRIARDPLLSRDPIK